MRGGGGGGGGGGLVSSLKKLNRSMTQIPS